MCVIFRHNDFEGTELYACLQWCKVDEEGAEAGIFKEDETGAVPPTDIPVTEESQKIPEFVLHASGLAEDIA